MAKNTGYGSRIGGRSPYLPSRRDPAHDAAYWVRRAVRTSYQAGFRFGLFCGAISMLVIAVFVNAVVLH